MNIIIFNKLLLNIKMGTICIKSNNTKDDELTQFLKSKCYIETELIRILDTKIIITSDHIKNIDVTCYTEIYNYDILAKFERYGYIFTNDDYIILMNKNELMLRYIPGDKRTNEIYEILIKKNGGVLREIPHNKKTYKICKIAVKQNKHAYDDVPSDMKTLELYNIAFGCWGL